MPKFRKKNKNCSAPAQNGPHKAIFSKLAVEAFILETVDQIFEIALHFLRNELLNFVNLKKHFF